MAKKEETKKEPLAPGATDTGKKDELVQVPSSVLIEMQERMAKMEQDIEESNAKTAGMEELLSKQASTEGEKTLRTKKSFEPKFRTVGIRKFPMGGDYDNMGYVIGWTNRGAYQQVDRTGVTPQYVDYIDVIFLGHETTEDGKVKAEKVKLLDLLSQGIKVNCKIVGIDRNEIIIPTGEEIDITTFDPQHGLVSTGEKIDGFVGKTEITYKIQIPGVEGVVEIDEAYVN